MILGGKRMPGTEDGLGLSCRHDHLGSVTAGTADLRERGSPTWRRRRPQGFRPKGRDMSAAPEPDSSPAAPPLGPGGGARLSHASPLDDFAFLPASGPPARRLACRRRALEAVEKVLTDLARLGCAVPLDALHVDSA